MFAAQLDNLRKGVNVVFDIDRFSSSSTQDTPAGAQAEGNINVILIIVVFRLLCFPSLFYTIQVNITCQLYEFYTQLRFVGWKIVKLKYQLLYSASTFYYTKKAK